MNEDEIFLLDKARENLKAARLLEQQKFFDIAASRIYYAMFYLAEALLYSRGQTFSSHSAVIAAFGREFARTGDLDPKFHQYLIKSQELRQTGDYGYRADVSPDSVKTVLNWAEEFLVAVESYLRKED
jgi:uncharacterized protein (UPF0332 family)